MYRIPKNNEHFNKCYESIAEVYVHNEIGKLLDSCADSLIGSAKASTMLSALDRTSIAMD